MAQKAELYLMDEPFSGVDANTERDLIFLLQEICNLGKTVVVIHHNIQTVPKVFDQVLFLNGTVIGCGEMKRTWTSDNLGMTFAQREQCPLSQEKLEELKTEGIRHFF